MVAWKKGAGEGWIGNLRSADATIIYRIDKKQGPTIQHRELFSVFYIYIYYIYITIFIYIFI